MTGKSSLVVDAGLLEEVRAHAASGADREAVERVLRSYFAGRRDAVRTNALIPVMLSGPHGSFDGVAVDVSRSGMLLRIMDSEFVSLDEENQLMPYAARVWSEFGDGFGATFVDSGVETRARVVRVTGYCGRCATLIRVGCRFASPLDQDQCHRLGVEWAQDRSLATGIRA